MLTQTILAAVLSFTGHDMSPEVTHNLEAAYSTVKVEHAKPIVRVYYSDFRSCLPCRLLRDDIGSLSSDSLAGLPFVFEPSTPPEWVTGTPAIHWEGADEWSVMYFDEWQGVSDFVLKWKSSQTKKTQTVKTKESARGRDTYSPRWTWPGDLGQHLRQVHGIDTTGMNQDDLERTHDNLHEGSRSSNTQSIRRHKQRRRSCPSGKC